MPMNHAEFLKFTRLAPPLIAMVFTCLASPAFAQDGGGATAGKAVRMNPDADESTEEATSEEAAPADAQGGGDDATASEDATVGGEAMVEEDPRLVTSNINMEGGVGFHKIASARPGRPMTFRAAFLGEFFSAGDIVRQGDSNSRAGGHVLIQGTLLEYLAFNFGLMARSNVNSYGQPEAMLTQGDLNFGVSGYYPVTDFLHIGGDLNLFIPAGFGSTGLSASSTSVRPRLLATLDTRPLTDDKVGLDVHFNFGYRVDNSENGIPDGITPTRVERFAYDLNAYDLLELGVGVEYELPYVRPFAGFYVGLPVNGADELCQGDRALACASDQGVGKSAPKYVMLGLKAEPIENFGLHAGVDLGLTRADAEGLPITPPYNLNFGLSWTIDTRTKVEYVEIEKVIEKKVETEAAATGMIVGVVVDSETEESVKRATIEYLGEDVSAQASSDINGEFRSYKFEPGKELKLRITHPDYEPAEVTATVQEGEIPLNIALKAIPKIAKITGRVVDDKDAAISKARVRIVPAKGEETTVPVDAGGNFLKDLPAGDYSVVVSADGFLTRGRDISLKANDKMALDIVLSPAPTKVTVKLLAEKIQIEEKVFFETGEATILPKSFNLLNQVAALMVENPQVKLVQIEGHTDDVGKPADNLDLSQRRAEAVKRYLEDQGVSPKRLSAKGYGSGKPILPNTSNRNRALNRRVEFNILEQDKPEAKPTSL